MNVATIEVKSILDEAAIAASTRTAINVKKLKQNIITSFFTGYQPPSILSYVVAYDGPAKMETVSNWIESAHSRAGVVYPLLPDDFSQRLQVASPSIDAVFVLGKGVIYFDNTPITFVHDELRSQHSDFKWVVRNSPNENLLLLFLFLTQAISGVSASWLNPDPYLSSFLIDDKDIQLM